MIQTLHFYWSYTHTQYSNVYFSNWLGPKWFPGDQMAKTVSGFYVKMVAIFDPLW